MTKEKIIKKDKLSSIIGLCELCMYKHNCKDILDGFNKPSDCEGPYDRYADQW